MSIQNGERLATKQDLADMYQGILPYLGGSADAGFTPVGTVISIMSNHAPANYLICNGTVYNIADYPELANHFLNEFGSKNYFGGNGTTTFAVPDLRGEFLRGTGTNSHANNGNGEDVGVHQDATTHNIVNSTSDTSIVIYHKEGGDNGVDGQNSDKRVCVENNVISAAGSYTLKGVTATGVKSNTALTANQYTSRPTNTSVLLCIATKNIYLNPANDYSTDEKVIGTWVDGSTLYQKTINCGTVPQAVTQGTRVMKNVAHEVSNIDRVVSLIGSCYKTSSLHPCESIMPVQLAMNNTDTSGLNVRIDATNIIVVNSNTAYNGIADIYVTIQYTKTT